MRFTNITIENFKNVRYGTISLVNPRARGDASILALYGQNGSGKSALVDSLLLFKLALQSKFIPVKYADYIMTGAESARFSFELEGESSALQFKVEGLKSKRFLVRYEIEIAPKSEKERANPHRLWLDDCSPLPIMGIRAEALKIRWEDDARFRTIFFAGHDGVIGPKSVFLASADKEDTERVKKEMRQAHVEGLAILGICSNLFNCYPEMEEGLTDLQLALSELSFFAHDELFIVGTRESESIESGRLAFFYDKVSHLFRSMERMTDFAENHNGSLLEGLMGFEEGRELLTGENDKGVVYVSTDPGKPTALSPLMKDVVSDTLSSVNIVLNALVPGLSLALAPSSPDDQRASYYIESVRGKYRLPLFCESRGIQKIVSVAWLLINVYNRKDFVAVIDELDSGIFEYLLGEILRIVSEEGRGQLIFTSHNLRPLEVLDKGYIAFTTTNPKKRYVRMKNVKTTNNLRDFYFRSIFLGGQEQSLYEPTKNGEISLAFIKAGAEKNRRSNVKKAHVNQDSIDTGTLNLLNNASSIMGNGIPTLREKEDCDD